MVGWLGWRVGVIIILKRLFIDRSSGGCFLGKCVRTAAKTMVVDRKKPEGTSSAILGIGTAAKYCELKRCAYRVRSTELTTKMKS